MVHFWATWCAPCEAELPEFIDLAKKFEKITFFLIAVNDEEKKIHKFFKRFGELPPNVRLAHDEEGEGQRSLWGPLSYQKHIFLL